MHQWKTPADRKWHPAPRHQFRGMEFFLVPFVWVMPILYMCVVDNTSWNPHDVCSHRLHYITTLFGTAFFSIALFNMTLLTTVWINTILFVVTLFKTALLITTLLLTALFLMILYMTTSLIMTLCVMTLVIVTLFMQTTTLCWWPPVRQVTTKRTTFWLVWTCSWRKTPPATALTGHCFSCRHRQSLVSTSVSRRCIPSFCD